MYVWMHCRSQQNVYFFELQKVLKICINYLKLNLEKTGFAYSAFFIWGVLDIESFRKLCNLCIHIPNVRIVKHPSLVLLHRTSTRQHYKGIQHKPMVKSVYERRWLHLLVNSKLLICSKRQFWDKRNLQLKKGNHFSLLKDVSTCMSCIFIASTSATPLAFYKTLLVGTVADLRGCEGHVPPPPGPTSFNFMQFWGKFGKIVCWRPPPGELASPPQGNPG